jgi:hypothetical protein
MLMDANKMQTLPSRAHAPAPAALLALLLAP